MATSAKKKKNVTTAVTIVTFTSIIKCVRKYANVPLTSFKLNTRRKMWMMRELVKSAMEWASGGSDYLVVTIGQLVANIEKTWQVSILFQ